MPLPTDTTARWLRWAAGAAVSLLAVMAAVFLAGLSEALFVGWAIGMTLAATLILFQGRR